jgi:putative flavoprotein involved in K+ transport
MSWPDDKNDLANELDVVVVGAGAAGVGVGVALLHAGVERFAIADRHAVGASFAAWPQETRFITPSFPTNSIGMLDLNSVAIGTSPAYSLEVEHPTGQEFSAHLRDVAEHFKLPVRTGIDVRKIDQQDGQFLIQTTDGVLRARHLIWAAGEFQYPRRNGFPGAELCMHTADVDCYEDLPGEQHLIIGGYESGIDAAYHLAALDRQVKVFDSGSPWKHPSSDPSVALSTYSLERMAEPFFEQQVELFAHSPVASVTRFDDGSEACYELKLVDGRHFTSSQPPILATGFTGSLPLIRDYFAAREDGYPLLSEHDESTITPGLYLVGPAVRHDQHVFCFIYKYRQRFAVVAKAIATKLGLPAEELEMYRRWGMYLDDLSCCGEQCAC